ncbi:MAG: class I SAM-dependent methyltransferase [Desulfobacca sp.]|uniref:class I SAM-dependent methyltransferase n=1 Tax=Desulfobacca sp. TaxID=2067990 RepID=UPI004049A3CF
MKTSWEREAVVFDEIYEGGGLVGKIPLLGPFIQRGIIERHNRALAFLQACGAKTILDLGCGVGRFAVAAARQGVTVFGYDISGPAIVQAQEAARQAGVSDRCHFFAADLHEVTFPPATAWFDLGCLHYLPDPALIVAKLSHVPHLFSCLPMKGHWLSPLHYIYRTLLRGQIYLEFTETEIWRLLAAYPNLQIDRSGMVYYVTTVVAV